MQYIIYVHKFSCKTVQFFTSGLFHVFDAKWLLGINFTPYPPTEKQQQQQKPKQIIRVEAFSSHDKKVNVYLKRPSMYSCIIVKIDINNNNNKHLYCAKSIKNAPRHFTTIKTCN